MRLVGDVINCGSYHNNLLLHISNFPLVTSKIHYVEFRCLEISRKTLPNIFRKFDDFSFPLLLRNICTLCHSFMFSVNFSLNWFPLFCGLVYMSCSFAYFICVPLANNLFGSGLSFCLCLVLELLQFTNRLWFLGFVTFLF